MQVTERLYSGSEPHGEEGIASLKELGVKTIVSVDGAKPAVDMARKYGMRYVHIPIGYDGVPEEAGQSLARLMREAETPIYVHCHHGKHRGPAAVAVACVAVGDMTGKEALSILVRPARAKTTRGCGTTSKRTRPHRPMPKLPELVEVAEVGSFTAAMAQVDRAFDNLKLCRDAKWTVPPDHPDLVPAQRRCCCKKAFTKPEETPATTTTSSSRPGWRLRKSRRSSFAQRIQAQDANQRPPLLLLRLSKRANSATRSTAISEARIAFYATCATACCAHCVNSQSALLAVKRRCTVGS